MKHLRFSYGVLAVCAALLIYGVIVGARNTSALFLDSREATGLVAASQAFPPVATAVLTRVPEETAEPEETVEPARTTEPEETEGPEETPEPEGTSQPEETQGPEETPQAEKTARSQKTRRPERTPERTRLAITGDTAASSSNRSAGTEACTGGLATLVFDPDIGLGGSGPFDVEFLLSNEGAATATDVLLGFEAVVGGQFLDEATFGNGQVWWPHGQRNSGVLYAVGDLAPGARASVQLTIAMLPPFGPGDPISIYVSVVAAECVDDRVDTMFVRLAYAGGEASVPEAGEATALAPTPVNATPASREATPSGEPPPAPTATPVPTSTSTPTGDTAAPAPRASSTPDGASPQATTQAVLGDESAPLPGQLPSITGEEATESAGGFPGLGGRRSQVLMVAALAVFSLLVGLVVGRRLG